MPFFALVLLGWLAARAGLAAGERDPGPQRLRAVLRPALHAVPLRRQPAAGAAALILRCSASTCCRGAADGRPDDRGDAANGPPDRAASALRDAAFGALVAAFPNAGFMGVPLLVALLGDAAAGPVIGAIVIDLVVTSTLCLALARRPNRTARRRDAERRRACGVCTALRGADQPAALGDRPRRRLGGRPSRELPSRRSARSFACSATRPRRWRCSRSAPCCCAPGSHAHSRTAGRPLSCRWR